MKELICIVCPKGCHLHVDEENGCSVTGNSCARGAEYGKAELLNPTRVVTSTARCRGLELRRCPVKTSCAIPKDLIFAAVRALDGVELTEPVRLGQVVAKNAGGSGADFIACRNIGAASAKSKTGGK